MSNQEMSEGPEMPSTDSKRNTRRVLEEMLEDNLISAGKALDLVHQVSDSLFGAKPTDVGEKEAATPLGGIFNRTKDVALKTKHRLGAVRDELNDIIKEIK